MFSNFLKGPGNNANCTYPPQSHDSFLSCNSCQCIEDVGISSSFLWRQSERKSISNIYFCSSHHIRPFQLVYITLCMRIPAYNCTDTKKDSSDSPQWWIIYWGLRSQCYTYLFLREMWLVHHAYHMHVYHSWALCLASQM